MSIKKEKFKSNKKRKTDSDGVKVKRSYYSFSKYYPGGGSEQKYLRVMHETPDEHRNIKIILSVFVLLVAVFIGYFSTTVALNISEAPTTTEPQSTLSTTLASEDVTQKVKTTAPTEKTTLEEPEREVNVTQATEPESNETTDN